MACSKVTGEFNAADSKCAETIRNFFNDKKRQNEECVVEVYTRLEKIFEYVNDATSECTIQTKWIKGLWNVQERRQGERSSHFLDVGLSAFEKGLVVKILRLEASGKCISEKESVKCISEKESDKCISEKESVKCISDPEFYSSVLSEQEIYDTKDMAASVTIRPQTKLIRWQLVSQILGHDIGYDHIIDTSGNNSDKSALGWSRCVARILIPRQIFYGQTQFRIKHKAQDKFLTVVTRNGWPSAALGLNTRFYFVLHETPEGIRIKAVNSTVPDYDVLYSSEFGAIYFDRWTTGLKKQCWTINKADPLCNGDTVSFMNKWWDDSALCFNGSVSCSRNTEDEWILMI